MLLKAINLGAAAVLLILGVLTSAWLAEMLIGSVSEPEDVLLTSVWTGFLFGVAGLCVWNARKGPVSRQIWSIQGGANLFILLAIAFVLVSGNDPLGWMLLGLAAVGPLAWSVEWTIGLFQRARTR